MRFLLLTLGGHSSERPPFCGASECCRRLWNRPKSPSVISAKNGEFSTSLILDGHASRQLPSSAEAQGWWGVNIMRDRSRTSCAVGTTKDFAKPIGSPHAFSDSSSRRARSWHVWVCPTKRGSNKAVAHDGRHSLPFLIHEPTTGGNHGTSVFDQCC